MDLYFGTYGVLFCFINSDLYNYYHFTYITIIKVTPYFFERQNYVKKKATSKALEAKKYRYNLEINKATLSRFLPRL